MNSVQHATWTESWGGRRAVGVVTWARGLTQASTVSRFPYFTAGFLPRKPSPARGGAPLLRDDVLHAHDLEVARVHVAERGQLGVAPARVGGARDVPRAAVVG